MSCIEDFRIIKPIGKDAFGTVQLGVKKNETDVFYAIKQQSRKKVEKSKSYQKALLTELKVFFIVLLFFIYLYIYLFIYLYIYYLYIYYKDYIYYYMYYI